MSYAEQIDYYRRTYFKRRLSQYEIIRVKEECFKGTVIIYQEGGGGLENISVMWQYKKKTPPSEF